MIVYFTLLVHSGHRHISFGLHRRWKLQGRDWALLTTSSTLELGHTGRGKMKNFLFSQFTFSVFIIKSWHVLDIMWNIRFFMISVKNTRKTCTYAHKQTNNVFFLLPSPPSSLWYFEERFIDRFGAIPQQIEFLNLISSRFGLDTAKQKASLF